MGNALTHPGDGFTVTEMSLNDSYYSQSESRSRTTTDDITASVITRQTRQTTRQPHNDGRTSDDSQPSSTEQRRGKHSSPRRYGIEYAEDGIEYYAEETESRTETSSAYHHGYRMRSEGRREEREGIEVRDDNLNDDEFERYGSFEHAYNNYQSRSPKSKNNGRSRSRSRSKNKNNKNNSQKMYRNTSPLKSKSRSRSMSRSPRQRLNKRQSDVTTLDDIPPAGTDMAWAGSEDEVAIKAQAIRENEIANQGYLSGLEAKRSNAKPEVVASVDQDEQQQLRTQTRPSNPVVVEDASASVGQQQRAQILLAQKSQFSDNDNNLEIDTLHSSSFSTLTKTMDGYLPSLREIMLRQEVAAAQEAAAAQAAQKNKPQKPTITEEEVEAGSSGSAESKLEELLLQQQLQEEKLQLQLEQLRIQKERLQQLHEEKKRTKSFSQDAASQQKQQQGSPRAHSEKLRIQKERMRAVKNSSKANSSLQASMEAARQELTRRDRLDRARQMVMPKEEKKDKHQASNLPIDIVPAVGESSTGTATGEMDGSFAPEFEDMPSHFGIENDAPDAFQENDMTTLSASLTEYADDCSTVSSMKDGPGEEVEAEEEEEEAAIEEAAVEEEEKNFGALHEVVSSMDEEIDLVFVSKYDKAFNAFLEAYPSLFDKDSDLLQNLKVAKLQRILEVSYQVECDLEAHLDTPSEAATDVESAFQQQLKDASRRNAEREIQLKTELKQIKKQSRVMQAKLTWDMLLLAVNRAKNLIKLKTELKSKELTTSHDMLASLPETTLMREVIKAVEAKPKKTFGLKEKKELQQYRVDNALLNAEVKVLQQRIAALRDAASQQDHLDRRLVKLDSKRLTKLKGRHQKKVGVSF